jgi:dTDP-4-dehydrorhamnose reductase
MLEQKQLLVTGGSGLLGGELRRLLPEATYPASSEFDVTNLAQMREYLAANPYTLLLHAAAFTSPPKVDQNPLRALEVNIVGTANVVRLCMERGIRLVYVSTDYVFRGDRGFYSEDDAVAPVNRYAWSKLGGECAVRLYAQALIIRTTFGPNTFPYERAFADQWTSRESVAVIARKIALLLATDLTGTIHVGGARRTVLDYARSLDPSRPISPMLRSDVTFAVPEDTSLDCRRFEAIMARLLEIGGT